MGTALALIALFFALTALAASSAPWLPTRRKEMERVLEAADLKPGQKFVDLGSGDGRLLLAAARRGALAIGYDLSLIPYMVSRARIIFARSSAKALLRDFHGQNLSDADVIYMFLTPPAMPKLAAKLRNEMKPGAKAVSYCFPLPGWEPRNTLKREGGAAIYVYEA